MIAQCGNRYGEALKRPRQKGAAMVEFAMVAGLLVTLFALLLEFSRIFNEFTWVSNTAYQLAAVLSGDRPATGLLRLPLREDDIVERYRKEEFKALGIYDTAVQPLDGFGFGGSYYHPDPNQRTVGLSFTARIKPLTSIPLTIPMKISVMAPHLIPRTPANLGQPQTPNPSFNCCGIKGASGPNGQWIFNSYGYKQCKPRADLCGPSGPCAGQIVCPRS